MISRGRANSNASGPARRPEALLDDGHEADAAAASPDSVCGGTSLGGDDQAPLGRAGPGSVSLLTRLGGSSGSCAVAAQAVVSDVTQGSPVLPLRLSR